MWAKDYHWTVLFRIRFLNYLEYLKDPVFTLVLRTTFVRLRPVLVLMGIYFAFLVSSINYVIAFSDVEYLYLIIWFLIE